MKTPSNIKAIGTVADASRRIGAKKNLPKPRATQRKTEGGDDRWEAPQACHPALRPIRKPLKTYSSATCLATLTGTAKPIVKKSRQATHVMKQTENRSQATENKSFGFRAVGLMSFPQPTAQEWAEIQALGVITQVLHQKAVLEPPGLPIRVAIDSNCDPKMAFQLATGTYELDETSLIKKHLRRGHKVLDIGACIGVTSALCGSITKKPVVAVEPNPALHDVIQTQATINGLSVQIEHGCVGPKAQTETSFHVHRQPWRSALQRYTDVEQDYDVVTCAMYSLQELTSRHKPDVVVIDVEGAERNLFRQPLRHKPSLFIVEIHNFYIGETACCEVVQQIIDQGYRLIDRQGWNWVFRLASASKRKA